MAGSQYDSASSLLRSSVYKTFNSGQGEGGSEVVAHEDQRLYVTNGAENHIDIFDIASGTLQNTLDLNLLNNAKGVNSVAVSNGIVVAAVEGKVAESSASSMLNGENGFNAQPIFTVGGILDNGYQPVGVMDGMGAMALNESTVRLFVNHELGAGKGKAYEVNGVELTGARISYFDIDKTSLSIVDGGSAITQIYDRSGAQLTDAAQLDLSSFDRLCSASLMESEQFGSGRGLQDSIFFSGEESSTYYGHPHGGTEWALDAATGEMWAVPAMGRGAWENISEVDTGSTSHVAFIMGDDFRECPLYMYVGEKNGLGDGSFLDRNGLAKGQMYVWVSNTGEIDPRDFNTAGTLSGKWMPIDVQDSSKAGQEGYDELGYKDDATLRAEADAMGAFDLSRPEDVATNPNDGSEVVLASTGRSSAFEGADKVGTVYTIKTDFSNIDAPTASVTILHDGDATTDQPLRSPDNLDWADDGYIYVQEDRADSSLFGEGAANSNEASIVRINPTTGEITRVASINRDAVPVGQKDTAPTDVGNWESSGIVDVSSLFGRSGGELFLAVVQAHSVRDGELLETGLYEGGQLSLISAPGVSATVQNPIAPLTSTNGSAAFYSATDGSLLAQIELGVLPDMVTFTPDGKKVLIALEAEPKEGVDAKGGVAIIDISNGVANATTTILDFTQFDGQEDQLREQGVRIFPNTPASEDLEPEYIAVSKDGSKAFVTLQENNAVAVVDLASNSITALQTLGTVDHSVTGIDSSDKDGQINITTHPVQGLRMADGLVSFDLNGKTYYATANEGDARTEDVRVAELTLDSTVFSNATALQSSDEMGRLAVSSIDGDIDGDGDYDALYSYGSRSFTIFDENGTVVFDSGDQIEQVVAALRPALFNQDDGEFDKRSDNKGPEPEAITVGEVNGALYAFVGLERDSGIMVYDISTPANAQYLGYIDSQSNGDVSPEVISFISAEESTTGAPQLAVAYEVSGTTTLINLDQLASGNSAVAYGANTDAATIESLYKGVLQTSGDQVGVGFWVNKLEAGHTTAEVAQWMIDSSAVQLAASDSEYLGDLYLSLLERNLDSNGSNFWLSKLAAGTTRAEVVAGLVESNEYQAKLVGIAAEGIEYQLWSA